MSLTISEPPLELLCDTTPIRYFTVVGQIDLLVAVAGGIVLVPREVLDLDEAEEDPADLISEIGKSERYFARRSVDPDAMAKWSRLRSLRVRQDLVVVDMDDEELETYAELRSLAFAKAEGIAPLGPGEAAVIAIAERRNVRVAMDDGPGRRVLAQRAPLVAIQTTRDLLRMAASGELHLIESPEAMIIYADMKADLLAGPDSLWEP
jgi:predicted nucleic acid-binding protein